MKLSHDSFLRMSKTPLERTGSFLFYGNSEFWIQSKINLLLKNNPSLQQIKPRILSQELFLKIKIFFLRFFLLMISLQDPSSLSLGKQLIK